MSSRSLDLLQECARAVEAAALDQRLWPAALATIRRQFDAAAAAIEIWDHRHSSNWSFLSDGFDQGGLGQVKALYPESNPRLEDNRNIVQGEITYDYKHRTEAELDRCGYIRDVEALTGTRYYVAGVPLRDKTHYTGISLFHERSQGHFTETDAAALQALLPVLQIGLRSSLMIGAHRVCASLASSTSPETGLVLLDCGGHPLLMNRTAECLFETTNAGPMKVLNVRNVIAAALDGRSSACRWNSQVDGRTYDVIGITIATDSSTFAPLQPRAALLIHDPIPRCHLLAGAVRDLYELSPREIEVCEALLAGAGPDQIARQLGIAESTVRVHLRSILLKTDAHSQVEVVARLRPFLIASSEDSFAT